MFIIVSQYYLQNISERSAGRIDDLMIYSMGIQKKLALNTQEQTNDT